MGAEQVEFYSRIDSDNKEKKEIENSKEMLQISNSGNQMDYDDEKQLQQSEPKSICESESDSKNNVIITATMTKHNHNSNSEDHDDNDDDEHKLNELLIQEKKETFFNWFYCSIAVGSFFAVTVIAYLCQNVGFDIGYLVPTICLMIGIIIFVSFSKYYKVTPVRKYSYKTNNYCGCGDSMLLLFCQILWHGLFDDVNISGNYSGTVALTKIDVESNINVIDTDVGDVDNEYNNNDNDIDINMTRVHMHWLDKCKVSLNGRFSDYDVESTKQVLNLLIYYVYFIFFCCAWFQVFNLLYAQGCQMVCVYYLYIYDAYN